MIPVNVVAELIRAHPVKVAVAVALTFVLVSLLYPFCIRSASGRRHRRYQKRASTALARLPQLRDDAARMVWLRKMNPYVFEEMLLTALSRQGFRIRRNASYSGDGGVDGQVWIDGQRWLIQAKRYSANINTLQVAAFGLLVEQSQCQGLFIHTGRTGEASRQALSRYPDIKLISGQRLLLLLAGERRWLDFPDNARNLPSQPSHSRSASPSTHS